jgi:ankyrin repeat protein
MDARKKEEKKIIKIIRDDNIYEMEEYLNNGGDPDFVISNNIYTPLCDANSKEMAELLLNRGANPHRIFFMGYTPLLWQAEKSNPEVVQLLLDKYPSLIYNRSSFRDNRETVLHKCVFSGNNSSLECVKILLAHKPPIDINGLTDDGESDQAFTALDYAVRTENEATWPIIELLLDNGGIRNDTTPSKYDDSIRQYMAAKNIARFIDNKINRRRKVEANFAPNGAAFE